MRNLNNIVINTVNSINIDFVVNQIHGLKIIHLLFITRLKHLKFIFKNVYFVCNLHKL